MESQGHCTNPPFWGKWGGCQAEGGRSIVLPSLFFKAVFPLQKVFTWYTNSSCFLEHQGTESRCWWEQKVGRYHEVPLSNIRTHSDATGWWTIQNEHNIYCFIWVKCINKTFSQDSFDWMLNRAPISFLSFLHDLGIFLHFH